MLKSEIAKHVGGLVGIKEANSLVPTWVYLLDDHVYGYWNDPWTRQVSFSRPRPGYRPRRGASGTWSYGYPVLRIGLHCSSRQQGQALAFLRECTLRPADVFEGAQGNLVAVRAGVLPATVVAVVATDRTRLVPRDATPGLAVV